MTLRQPFFFKDLKTTLEYVFSLRSVFKKIVLNSHGRGEYSTILFSFPPLPEKQPLSSGEPSSIPRGLKNDFLKIDVLNCERRFRFYARTIRGKVVFTLSVVHNHYRVGSVPLGLMKLFEN